MYLFALLCGDVHSNLSTYPRFREYNLERLKSTRPKADRNSLRLQDVISQIWSLSYKKIERKIMLRSFSIFMGYFC